MQRRIRSIFTRYLAQERNRRIWKRIVRSLACIVVFCTTYALILPAITLEQTYICELEEHAHGADCYVHSEIQQLICCGSSESVPHTHGEFCVDGQGNMLCVLEETEEHTHTDSCYTQMGHVHTDSCYEQQWDALVCELAEDENHTHEEACYTVSASLVCGQEEAPAEQVLSCGLTEAQSHQHTADCIGTASQETLVCTLEEHTHTDACKVDLSADAETAQDWEKTMEGIALTGDWAEDLTAVAASQLGYAESQRNFLCEDGVTRKGYTRYGAWYGTPYGDWDAMFVSFCLHYAGIPEDIIARHGDAGEWAAQIQSTARFRAPLGYTPVAGDLVFFADGTGTVTHMGIIYGCETEYDAAGTEVPSWLRTIEGDAENMVRERRIAISDGSIYGYGSLAASQAEPEQPLEETVAETDAATEAVEETVMVQSPIAETAAAADTETADTAVTELLINFGDGTNTVEYTSTYHNGISGTQESGLLHGSFIDPGGNHPYIRFTLTSSSYTIRSGDEVTIRMKMTDASADVGEFRPTLQVDSDPEPKEVALENTKPDVSGEYVIYRFDVSALAEKAFKLLDVKWYNAPEGAKGTYSIDYIRIGQPEEEPNPEADFQFTTADPSNLKEGVDYVIYTKSGTDEDTYTFLFASSNPPGAVTVNDSGFSSNPITVGGTWSMTADQMTTTNLTDFTWKIEKKDNGVIWIAANGYDNTKYPGPEYLCLKTVNKSVETWYNGGTDEGINLKIENTSGAASNISRADSGSENKLYYNGSSWIVQAADGTATTVYFAAVTEKSAPAVEPTETFTFTTADPTQLLENVDYAIYCRPTDDTDTYTFLGADNNRTAITAENTGHNSYPSTIGATWTLNDVQMGTTDENRFTWRIVKNADGNYYLHSQVNQLYLKSFGTKAVTTSNYLSGGTEHVVTGTGTDNDAACTMESTTTEEDGTKKVYKLIYDAADNVWKALGNNNTATTIYFASVTSSSTEQEEERVFPGGVSTGGITVNTLRFYNFVENGEDNISALEGCEFRITGADGYSETIISGSNPELALPTNMPDGTYTIEQISAPEGYIRDLDPIRSFEIQDGKFASGKAIGTFLNHRTNLVAAEKTAEVADYNNRTYQVMLSAESNLRVYQMNPVDVIFVLDQSNSMLFPAGLADTGKTVTLSYNPNAIDVKDNTNLDRMEALGLDKTKVYYIIVDPKGSSTAFAVWYDGSTWLYQDASYYAKAQQGNAEGYQQAGELAVFPIDAALDDQLRQNSAGQSIRANGGGLGYLISGGLGSEIQAAGGEKAYTIYTAVNGYNRLHYLQDALAHSIYQLADANTENTVSLIRFTSETSHENCIGPLELIPENVSTLVAAVGSINTSGGTRQDKALAHAHDHLTGKVTYTQEDGSEVTADLYNKGQLYTFTVLITDGAPVLSNDSKSYMKLGDAADGIPTAEDIAAAPTLEVTPAEGETEEEARSNANEAKNVTVYGQIKYYGQQVREESILMTIGLGMGQVDGGGEVLKAIASEPKAAYHMMLENAEALMDVLKQLLFSSMRPREKVDLMGDISDVVSDSFYPIAYTELGGGESTLRKVLYSDSNYDWIILEEGDWITQEGEYVGPTKDAYSTGQLTVNQDGDYCIVWDDQIIYDCALVWVPAEDELPAGKTLVTVDDQGRKWFALDLGDKVYSHGEYVVDPGNPKTGENPYDPEGGYRIVGEYVQLEGDPRPHIQWENYYGVNFDEDFQRYPWYGKFYIKAKEDFIGGNAIDTNKTAGITLDDNDTYEENHGTILLKTPTVNVRLLDMNQSSSQVTVFLGDMINAASGELAAPLDSLKAFYTKTIFTKLIADFENKGSLDYGPVMNALDPGSSAGDGLETDVFYLKYAIGRDLTEDEWARLVGGERVTVEYTYDNPSSHGPVGFFTFQLTKTGDTADYTAHEATKACDKQHTHDGYDTSVETYILHVTYTAYKLGEASQDGTSTRPDGNAHNSTAGPGTEVGGTEAGDTLPEGYGIVDKDNVHEVHVLSGSIEVTKEITDNLKSEADQTYNFTLHRTEDGVDIPLEVTIKAGETSGSALVTGLKRGTYVVSEQTSTVYQVMSITIDKGRTNCFSAVNSATETVPLSVEFHIGWDKDADEQGGQVDVIGKALETDTYTSYTGSPDGVFGAMTVVNTKTIYSGKVPVEKIWSDASNQDHSADAVYAVMYKDDQIIRDGEYARIIQLDAANGWKGEFIVPLANAEDKVSDHIFVVREVAGVTGTQADGLHSAILYDGDPATEDAIVCYEKEAEEKSVIRIGDNDYLVEYGTGEDGTLTITNHRARVMPESGGMGTQMYTFSGLLCVIMAALMYGYSQKRKREGRTEE